ncbi:MAG TPA: DUF4215 domain-containing protein [Polyangia bacterium]|nr:DUF4215 domain-containing protein [Polyangia bacterium]
MLAPLGCAGVKTAGGDGGSGGGAGFGFGGETGGTGGTGGSTDMPFDAGDPFDTAVTKCGNGVREAGEGCDDGNTDSGDGCSSMCKIEDHYTCPTENKPCIHDVICGDGRIDGNEACDDGNTQSGDGCAMDCTLECGWECPPGTACRALKCGDGMKAGIEQCDDGNTTDGDGCSSTCVLESRPVTEPEGWLCTSPKMANGCIGPTTCAKTTCGNGTIEGSEQCDGTKDAQHPCSPLCRLEPVCPDGGGACVTACGDGLLLPADIAAGQECDDGNTVSGDGCSSTCKKEVGFTCNPVTVKPDKLVLPIIFHDFKGWNEGDTAHDHPDFQHFPGNGKGYAGIVQQTLGPFAVGGGVPVHVTGCFPTPGMGYPALLTANGCASSGTPAPAGPAWDPAVDWFGMWYVDNPTYNKTIVQTLTLPPIAGGAFQFSSDNTPPGFFTIDGLGWGNGPNAHNFGFTSVVRAWFEYSGTANLTFFGDDDVWVFINKKLAVDLGGTHQRSSGSVTLDATSGHGYVCDFGVPGGNAYPSPACTATATGPGAGGRDVDLGLKIGSVYEIAVFQAERYTSESNYQLTMSGFTGEKSQCVGACGDGHVTPPEKCDLGAKMNTGAYGGCKADCTLAPYCGDGVVQNPPEQCDGTPGCSKTCKTVSIDNPGGI